MSTKTKVYYGYDVEQALACAEDAKRDGLLGKYPLACIVLAGVVREAIELLIDVKTLVHPVDERRQRIETLIASRYIPRWRSPDETSPTQETK